MALSIEPAERIRSFLPYQDGLNEAAAQWETRRCLSCGLGARVDQEKCAGCLTCLRVCPYSAPEIGEYAAVSAEKCLVCGICASKCPAGAITIGDSAESEEAVVSVERVNRDIPAEAGKITVFVCRGVCAVIDMAALTADPDLKEIISLIEIPTAGAMRLEWILQAFEHKAAGAAIIGCAPDQCRHPADSANCWGVYRRAKALLEQLGIPPERLNYGQPANYEEMRKWLATCR